MSFNTHSLFHTIAAMMLISSCTFQDEVISEQIKINEGVTITATLELPQDATKTSLADGGNVLWSEGDALSLLTDSSNDRFELIEGAGQASATFSGSTSADAPYYALYPYSENARIQNGNLKFSLPKEQNFINGTFESGAAPAIACLSTLNDAAAFKNLCGILELNFCGTSSIKIKSVEIINLDGQSLWGNCSVALDGKQGTDEQSMTITGGSNILNVNFAKVEALKASTPKTIDVVVPAGSFAKGFGVKIKDADGAVVSFLTCQKEEVKILRSYITSMEKNKVTANGESLDVSVRGYYKDVFMDGGCNLTSRTSLPACPYLGWTLDYLATSDSLFQEKVIIKSSNDANGALLYPDGEPRYRMVYVNGGKANSHAKSLTSTGRSRLQSFVNNGGCYVGSCAGAFLAHSETSTYKYLGLIPATMTSSGLSDSYTGMKIPSGSPLLNYGYDYGGDFYVDSVYHNGGGYMKSSNLPAKGEILATFVKSGWVMNGNGSIWAYKASDAKGRVLVTGSHPEGVTSGEQRDLMAAMMQYACDGAGTVSTKAALTNGTVRTLNKTTGTNAGIGDKQYHHYTVDIPSGAKNIKVNLTSTSDLDLHLAMRRGSLAWRSDADIVLAQSGSSKTLEFESLKAGTWYISVYCPAEVKTICGSETFNQSGDVAALNGVPYSISVSWE